MKNVVEDIVYKVIKLKNYLYKIYNNVYFIK